MNTGTSTLVAALALILTLGGCGKKSDPAPANKAPVAEDAGAKPADKERPEGEVEAVESPAPKEAPVEIVDISKEILAALNDEDKQGLKDVLMPFSEYSTKDNFAAIVTMKGASRLPPRFVFDQMSADSDEDRAVLFGKYAGKNYSFVRLEISKVIDKGHLRLWHHCTLVVKDPEGKEVSIRAFGDFITDTTTNQSWLLYYKFWP